jgi:hypothetical protein
VGRSLSVVVPGAGVVVPRPRTPDASALPAGPGAVRLAGDLDLATAGPVRRRLLELVATERPPEPAPGPDDTDREGLPPPRPEHEGATEPSRDVDRATCLLMLVHGLGPEDARSLLGMVARAHGVATVHLAAGLIATAAAHRAGSDLQVLDPRTRAAVRAALGRGGWEILGAGGRPAE